jgi:uncharacterized protein YfdQ (DUF2303 family)
MPLKQANTSESKYTRFNLERVWMDVGQMVTSQGMFKRWTRFITAITTHPARLLHHRRNVILAWKI